MIVIQDKKSQRSWWKAGGKSAALLASAARSSKSVLSWPRKGGQKDFLYSRGRICGFHIALLGSLKAGASTRRSESWELSSTSR